MPEMRTCLKCRGPNDRPHNLFCSDGCKELYRQPKPGESSRPYTGLYAEQIAYKPS